MAEQKMSGTDRRDYLLKVLNQASEPLTGNVLAKKTGVSRQVIVQDISLLKATGEQIMATSQGYLLIKHTQNDRTFKRLIVCQHTPEETAEELYLMVDQGVMVRNVVIEHPVYGDLEATLMLKDRHDVNEFLTKIKTTNAPYLAELTDGVHIHTLESDREEKIDSCIQALEARGFIFHSEG